MRRFAFAVAVAATAATALAACGSDPKLVGLQRTPPLEVGGVTLPQVAPTEADFAMKASAPDRLLVVYFGYTNCPDLCPTTLADLRKAFRIIGADAERVDVAFSTVDPNRDTPEVLSGYLSSFFSDRWHALRTEDPAALAAAEDPFLASSAVATAADGTIEVSHTAVAYVIDATGKVVVEWNFPTPGDDMANDLRLLLDDPDLGQTPS